MFQNGLDRKGAIFVIVPLETILTDPLQQFHLNSFLVTGLHVAVLLSMNFMERFKSFFFFFSDVRRLQYIQV